MGSYFADEMTPDEIQLMFQLALAHDDIDDDVDPHAMYTAMVMGGSIPLEWCARFYAAAVQELRKERRQMTLRLGGIVVWLAGMAWLLATAADSIWTVVGPIAGSIAVVAVGVGTYRSHSQQTMARVLRSASQTLTHMRKDPNTLLKWHLWAERDGVELPPALRVRTGAA